MQINNKNKKHWLRKNVKRQMRKKRRHLIKCTMPNNLLKKFYENLSHRNNRSLLNNLVLKKVRKMKNKKLNKKSNRQKASNRLFLRRINLRSLFNHNTAKSIQNQRKMKRLMAKIRVLKIHKNLKKKKQKKYQPRQKKLQTIKNHKKCLMRMLIRLQIKKPKIQNNRIIVKKNKRLNQLRNLHKTLMINNVNY